MANFPHHFHVDILANENLPDAVRELTLNDTNQLLSVKRLSGLFRVPTSKLDATVKGNRAEDNAIVDIKWDQFYLFKMLEQIHLICQSQALL